jgi:hypothetical protein
VQEVHTELLAVVQVIVEVQKGIEVHAGQVSAEPDRSR